MMKIYIICSILCFTVLSSCLNRVPPVAGPISSGNDECDLGIGIYNKHISGKIVAEIKHVNTHSSIGLIELDQLYPNARDAWNRALDDVDRNFSYNDTLVTLNSFHGSFSSWRSQTLEDYQKFFIILTERRYGPYPEGSADLYRIEAWIEHADINKRLNAKVRSIQELCRNLNLDNVKILLNAEKLPNTINECLTVE